MKSLEEILYEGDDDLPDNPDFNFQKEIKSFINKTKIENSFEYYGRKHSVLTIILVFLFSLSGSK